MTAEGTPSNCAFGKKAAGLTLIFCTAIIWILTSFISESLVAGDVPKVPAFLLTWLATTLFTLYLPALQLRSLVAGCWQRYKSSSKQRRYTAVQSTDGAAVSLTGFEEAVQRSKASAEAADSAAQDAQAATAALWATPLWFLAQYAFNLSLALTSVTSNTILSSTSSLFTFGLSVVLLGEKFTLRKLACILACIAGTALVTLSDVRAEQATGKSHSPPPDTHMGAADLSGRSLLDSSFLAGPGIGLRPSQITRQLFTVASQMVGHRQGRFLLPHAAALPQQESAALISNQAWRSLGPDASSTPGATHAVQAAQAVQSQSVWSASEPGGKAPLLGDLLVLASGALYAGYTVVMRLKMPGEEAGQQVAQFFGYVGLFTTVGLAPLVVILLSIGSINLSTIPRESYLIILFEGLLDYVLSDYLWARAVMLVGPTVATLSLSVQIPITAVMDLIVGEIPAWTRRPDTVAMSLIGTAGILAGFVGINLGSNSESDGTPVHADGQGRRAGDGTGENGVQHHAVDISAARSGSDTGSGAVQHRHGLYDNERHGSARSSLDSRAGRSPRKYFDAVAQAVVGVLVAPGTDKSKGSAP